jgi:integrase/recombinase XerD
MSANLYYTRTWVLRRYARGPIASHIAPFSGFLANRGYSYGTGQRYVREVGRLSRWLNQRQIDIVQLNEETIQVYLRSRKKGLRSRLKKGPYLQLLKYLRQNSIIETPMVENTPINECLGQYREHLLKNHGMSEETMRGRIRQARCFLTFRFGRGSLEFSKLLPQDIERFLLDRSRQCKATSIRAVTSALRCFLRFLQFRGDISAELIDSVPSVSSWRHREIPGFIVAEDINLLLQNCKCDTPQGKRDLAMLLLLVRLGLRAVEIRRLTLDDIDWHGGFITVLGKNGKRDRLPLLYDVGEAIGGYLHHGRPRCSTRHVFVRAVAPFEPFTSSCAIANVVRGALFRAGLNPPQKGSHLLRRSLATLMLQGGASLLEIGQILRHQKADTTAIYAKIDLGQLHLLARPWPKGGGR